MAQCKHNVRSLLHIRVRWLYQVSVPSEAWAALYTKLAGSRMCCARFPPQSIEQSVWVNATHTKLDSVLLHQGCTKISRLGEYVDGSTSPQVPFPFFFIKMAKYNSLGVSINSNHFLSAVQNQRYFILYTQHDSTTKKVFPTLTFTLTTLAGLPTNAIP